MTFWTDTRIKEAMKAGTLVINPFDPEKLQPGSLDLTLSAYAQVPEPHVFTRIPNKDDIAPFFKKLDLSKGPYLLEPGGLLIAQADEYIVLPRNVQLSVHTRSSYARLGISADLSSYANPGYSGNLPIVMKNHGCFTLPIQAGLRVCQAVFFEAGDSAAGEYAEKGKYAGESGYVVPDPGGDAELREFREQADEHNGGLYQFIRERTRGSYQEFISGLSEEERLRLGLGAGK